MDAKIIQVRPARTSARGREYPPQYLYRFNYPPLLSGQRPTVTATGNPADALAYDSQDSLDAALRLLESLGYTAPGLAVVPAP